MPKTASRRDAMTPPPAVAQRSAGRGATAVGQAGRGATSRRTGGGRLVELRMGEGKEASRMGHPASSTRRFLY